MPFSLYAHIPYCLVKCPYCDFNAYAAQTWPEAEYVDALCAEFQHYVTREPWQGQTIDTIYFGGGTPSLFAPTSLLRFLDLVRDRCLIAPQIEISLEADPAALTQSTLTAFREIGINRLSLGVQSFQLDLLKTLGRLHNGEQGRLSVAWARTSGFTNISVDLIFAVPGQTLTKLDDDLTQIFSCAPEHVSLYNLTYEEKTPFFAMRQKGLLQPIDEDEEVAMYQRIRERCMAHGYAHYEISSFARPEFSSRHNANYWNGGNYLGLGAGAHSFTRESEWGMRWSNERLPRRYIEKALCAGDARSFSESLTQTQAQGEFVFLRLRQLAGFLLPEFHQRFGIPFLTAFPHVTDLLAEELLVREGERLRLSDRGLLLADSIFTSFF